MIYDLSYSKSAVQILSLPRARRNPRPLDNLHNMASLLAGCARGPIVADRVDKIHDVCIHMRLFDRQVLAAQIRLIGQCRDMLAAQNVEAERVTAVMIDVCDLKCTRGAI